MIWPNKWAIIILFMALAIGSQTTSCCPVALAIGSQTTSCCPVALAIWKAKPLPYRLMALAVWKAKPLPCRLISFMSMVISLKTVEAAEATAPEGSEGANKIEYKSEDLRDPFQEEKIEIKEQPQEEIETKPLPHLEIQGIVWGGGFPQAIINNKVGSVGDTIEGVRITDIDKNGVFVFFENRQYNLSTSSPISSENLAKINHSGR